MSNKVEWWKKPNFKISEYYTKKYDDIDRFEKAILAQMSTSNKSVWGINDFRGIKFLKNDGEFISDKMAGLQKKGYLNKVKFGWSIKED